MGMNAKVRGQICTLHAFGQLLSLAATIQTSALRFSTAADMVEPKLGKL